MKTIFPLLFLCLFIACKTARTITDRHISFSPERFELSNAYIKSHYGLDVDQPTIVPKIIVLHWTAIPTLEKSFAAFKNDTLPTWRPELQDAGKLNVSAHFLVDRDGTIYRLMPETTLARHVIGLNYNAIGVENVGGTKDTPMTRAQIDANAWLVKYLAKKYPIEYLIGHYEYTQMENTPLWLEKDDSYRTEKTDPGVAFMNAVRKKTKNLSLKPAPKTDKN